MSLSDPRERKRDVVRALLRGLLGRCPQCGRGRLIIGYIAPVSTCSVCGEALAPYQTADFAPYLVVFVVGLIFTPLIVLLSLSSTGNGEAAVVAAAALASALILLPRAKGAAVALLWALDIRSNQ